MTDRRRYLIDRGFGHEHVNVYTQGELADALSYAGRMLDANAQDVAEQAWDSGRGSWGLVEVERQELT